MDTRPLRLVYLGNLFPVARALASIDGASLVACVLEDGDEEVDAFRVFAGESRAGFFVVADRKGLSAALDAVSEIDFGIIANFGLILSEGHLALARHGFVNAHLGLLPEYPGRHPIREAMRCSETVTGVTLHRVTPQVDYGPILDHRLVPMPATARGEDVFERLSRVAGEVLAGYLKSEIGKYSI